MSADAPAPLAGVDFECQGCKWWQADNDNPDDTGGTCHRYPPTVHAGTWGSYLFFMKTTSTHWPDADAFDYCGEHTPNTTGSATREESR